MLDVPAGGQRPRTVEHADIVEAEEAALEDVQTLWILSVHPPGEVQQQLVEDTFQEIEVARAAILIAVVLEYPHRRPGVHRRVDVAERPFVGRQFAVRIHQPDPAEQLELPLGELGVDQRQRDAMKGEVPGREPGIFPLVRHRHDIGGHQVAPIGVAAVLAALGRRRLQRIAVEPLSYIEIVELLVPQHPGKGLALDAPHVLVGDPILPGGVEEIGLAKASAEDVVKVGEGRPALFARAQPDPDCHTAAFRNRPQVEPRGLGAVAAGIHRVHAAVNDIVVERVLEVTRPDVRAEQPREIGLVVTEQQAVSCFEFDAVGPEVVMVGQQPAGALVPQRRLVDAGRPAPSVAEPDLRQDMNGRRIGSAVVDRDPHEHVVHVGLRVLDVDIEVAVVIENAGVDQLELHRRRTFATSVLLDQPFVRVCGLRQLVERAGVGVARDGVEVVVNLLDVLAVVALFVGQAEQPLLENGVAAVPQGERQAQKLPVIGKAGEAVLAPAIGTTARLIVGEIIPCRTVWAVVLAHRPPLPLAEIGTPPTPILCASAAFLDASLFGLVDLRHWLSAPVWRFRSRPVQLCLVVRVRSSSALASRSDTNLRTAGNSMILLFLLNQKFAIAFAARWARTSGSGH